MNPLDIIRTYYPPNSKAYQILLAHSEAVTNKAIELAEKHPEISLDISFIEEAAMLHDIGIFQTNAPDIDCHGKLPYICHGYAGAELLRNAGYPRHALVCERHTGSGITMDTIQTRNLPLPLRDMCPISLEEKLICYADKFFSKSQGKEKTLNQIRNEMLKFGQASLDRFNALHTLFA